MFEVKGLIKEYGSFRAVDNVSLTAENGKITILLGPNGAGKSTTIKSIAGLLGYDGDVLINGYNNRSLEAKKSFGYIAEAPVFYENLTVEEHINFIGKAYKVENYWERANYLLDLFHLSDKKKSMAKELSKGMTQKLSIILALLPSPSAILIDEPMIGLDPQAIEEVLQLIVKLKEENVAVLISTHIIDVIDGVWDEAYIMDHGQIKRKVVKSEMAENESLKEIFFECVGE